jgi:hypothetical protein
LHGHAATHKACRRLQPENAANAEKINRLRFYCGATKAAFCQFASNAKAMTVGAPDAATKVQGAGAMAAAAKIF